MLRLLLIYVVWTKARGQQWTSYSCVRVHNIKIIKYAHSLLKHYPYRNNLFNNSTTSKVNLFNCSIEYHSQYFFVYEPKKMDLTKINSGELFHVLLTNHLIVIYVTLENKIRKLFNLHNGIYFKGIRERRTSH